MPWIKPKTGVVDNPFSMLAFDSPSVDMIAVLKNKGVITNIDAYSTLSAKLTSVGVKFDSFNRADSLTSMGSTDTGQAWVGTTGTWGISNNQAYLVTVSGGFDPITIDSGVSDCSLTIKIGAIMVTPGKVIRLVARYTNANNYLMAIITTTDYRLYKNVADAATLLGTYSAIPATGDRVRLDMLGSSVKLFVNGTERLSVTETFNQTATKHGLSSNWPEGKFDNFTVEA